MDYKQLVQLFEQTNEQLLVQAVRTVNTSLTIRNWLFGFYLVEYEQNGNDRAEYGEKLLAKLSDEISIKGLTAPELSRCRQFYQTYPEIFGTLSHKFKSMIPKEILGTASQICLPGDSAQIVDHVKKLLSGIPYSHFIELIKIDAPNKRRYYEMLILKTTPSVRELRRQITSLSFERLGLSSDTKAAFKDLESKVKPVKTTDIVKSHYIFDFLKIGQHHVIEESKLEQALIDHLQEFIIELGNGFCFESRQKRILIGDDYYFIDLVFYHRILKCHVLIELKVDEFKHSGIGQLNTYLNYYKTEIKQENDNPPVGILLVTDKNDALVQYATAGMSNRLFVSKYLVKLPSKEKLEAFVKQELKKL